METSLIDTLDRWAATTSPSELLAATTTWLAVAAAGYLTLVTAAYVAALLARAPRLVRRLEPLTPAVVRRVAHRVVALAVLGSTWGGGTVAVAAETAPLPPALQVPVIVPSPAELASPAEVPAPEVAPPRGADPASAPAPASVTVVAGDHLWGIAARTLAAARGDEPSVAETARYWRAVVARNAPRLRSGDPDLIHPGETVHLPPLEPHER